MQSLSSLCRRIIERYAIKAANIIGAYDSAPTRKTDPSGYFDWKLFNSLVGIYPHLFDSSQLDADQQREVLLESMPQSDARVRILQQQLNRYEYILVFSKYVFISKNLTNILILRFITKKLIYGV
jgi:N-acetyl-anhydromuramyl-L-alanine amidase AmpD